MCGVAGIWSSDERSIVKSDLDQMALYLRHRGPDFQISEKYDNVGLVHAQLKVVNQKLNNKRLITSRDGRWVISYNGEVYNYHELGRSLGLSSDDIETDAQVVVEGIAQMGLSFIERMNGAFAFAVVDTKENDLFLVRDRLGIKPLYIYEKKTNLFFSSEIKPLLTHWENSGIEAEAFNSYFSSRYSINEKTLFKGINLLPKASILKINQKGERETLLYWSLLNCSKAEQSRDSFNEKFEELLKDSVRLRTEADYPVGALLSGGVDSSVLTAIASCRPNFSSVFTYGTGLDNDESHKAQKIASLLDLNHEIISSNSSDVRDYKRVLWSTEEPIGDSILLPTWLLFKKIKDTHRVVLAGEGADEILLGYIHHQLFSLEDSFANTFTKKSLPFMGKIVEKLPWQWIQKLAPYPTPIGRQAVKKLSNQLQQYKNWPSSYREATGLFSYEALDSLLNQPYLSVKNDLFSDDLESFDSLTKYTQFRDLATWNERYSLLRLDKISMAFGVEVRVPYLDHRLVELCWSAPQKYLSSAWETKRPLRNVARKSKKLPLEFTRAKKQAFFIPVERSFGESYSDYCKDVLSSRKFKERGYFNLDLINKMIDDKDQGLMKSKQLFSIFIFELWCQLYLDNEWSKCV